MTKLSGTAIKQSHIVAAIADYDRRGRDEFLRHYRFGAARTVFLLHNESHYEAKAIVGVAYGYATGTFITGGDPDYTAGQARNVLRRLGFTVTDRIWSTDIAPVEIPQVKPIPLEQNMTETYTVQVPPEAELVRERREARLVGAYAAYLGAQGHTVFRHAITVDGEILVTDLFDETTGELIEAKSSVDRGVIRLALGQILDYERFVQPDSLALLLPRRPSDDLCALLTANDVSVIWPEGPGFHRD